MTVLFRDPRAYGAGRSAEAIGKALGVDLGRFFASLSPAPRRRPSMFAYRPPEQVKPHTPEELAREELACLTPAFQGILGDPAIEQRNKQAMATAIATLNRGLDGDIPANGTEQGYVAAKFPVIGTRAGRAIPGGTETYLPVSRDDAPFPAPLIAPRDLTNIHTHQSPRRALGLSAADIIDTEPPPRGLGMNIVVLDRDGKRYCRLARQ